MVRWIGVALALTLMAVTVSTVPAFEPNQTYRMSLPVIEAGQQPATMTPLPALPTATPTALPDDTTPPSGPVNFAVYRDTDPRLGRRVRWNNPTDADLVSVSLYQCRAAGSVPWYCDFSAANKLFTLNARPGELGGYFVVETTEARRCFWVIFTDRSGNSSLPQPNDGRGLDVPAVMTLDRPWQVRIAVESLHRQHLVVGVALVGLTDRGRAYRWD